MKARAFKKWTAVFAAVLLVASCLVVAGCSCSNQSSSEKSAGVQVPNLVSLQQKDAAKVLANSGLVMGKKTYEYSDTVPNGTVISQDPAALTMVKAGSSVSITVSKGKEKPGDVTVPNLIGMSQTDAEQALKDAKLIALEDDPVVSTDVDPGKVCQQSIDPGTTVKEGTQVEFATALAPDTVTVPDETGKSIWDAKTDLENIGLGLDTTDEYNDDVEKDNIIYQSVAPGTQVAKGTVITLTVSLGPKSEDTVVVPDVSTLTLDEAVNTLTSAHLNTRYTGEENGLVVFQDPEAGTEVEVGSTVTITLQDPTTIVTIPDVSGMSGSDAEAALADVGLSLDYDTDNPDRVLSGTNPEAGTDVDSGSVVDALYADSPGPVGGWEVNTDSVASSLSDDEQQVFDEAQAENEATYEGVAVLATQTADGGGTRYAVLCRDASSNWNIAGVTDNGDGTASFDGVGELDPDGISTGSMGAWAVADSPSALPDEVENAFDAAMSGYTGASISPVALLASQVVDGSNYLVICEGDAVYAVVIAVDSSGSASVASADIVDLNSYTS